MSWRSVLACVSLVLCISEARAAEALITSSDLVEIRRVIHRQIDAFRRDDAQSCLRTAVTGRAALLGAAGIAFLNLLVMSGDVVQQVQITDRAGGVWLAYYSMQRQADGSWRTNGCHLVQPNRTISA